MQIIEKSIKEITPYEKNPRENDEAVEYVAKYVVIRQDNQGIVIATRKRFALAVSLDFSIK